MAALEAHDAVYRAYNEYEVVTPNLTLTLTMTLTLTLSLNPIMIDTRAIMKRGT